ncbi:MAG: DNA-directed RNA polymerase subunit K [Candidatus Pacearchaeota archaeon]
MAEKAKAGREERGKSEESYTRYEIARIIAARALQLSMNAPILLKLSKEQLESLAYNPIKIAELEFKEGVLPITVKRPRPRPLLLVPYEEELPEKIVEAGTEEEKEKEKEEVVAETIESELEPVEIEEKEVIEEEEEKEGFEE